MTFDSSSIFSIRTEDDFEKIAIKLFNYQYKNNGLYRNYCDLVLKGKKPTQIDEIPFLPIQFFKSHTVKTTDFEAESIFSSSGTTGSTPSLHHIHSKDWYLTVCTTAFELQYGSLKDFRVLALLPSYLEREGSSLIDMVEHFISSCGNHGDFYLNHKENLVQELNKPFDGKTLLIGVTYSLLDFAEQTPIPLNDTVIMETGGMKGRRKEMIREEVHEILKSAFSVERIHSEYGMTELLSQAYSKGNGIYTSPSWMRVLTRQTSDPFTYEKTGKTGGINIIDLSNWKSCAFIQTQDLGRVYRDNSFEILGRFDDSETRGCNLMVQ